MPRPTDYTIEIEKSLKIPLKMKIAQENTTIKAWVSSLIRHALAEECDCGKGQKAA